MVTVVAEIDTCSACTVAVAYGDTSHMSEWEANNVTQAMDHLASEHGGYLTNGEAYEGCDHYVCGFCGQNIIGERNTSVVLV